MGNKGSKDKNIELEMQGPEPDEEKIDLFNLPDKNLDLAPTMIEVVNLRKVDVRLSAEYELAGNDKEKVIALREINISNQNNCEIKPIREGEFLMLRGPSGCGKTTLLNILGTIDKLTEGKICMDSFT
jgi:putative ABC transport system ATP-binding protein